MSTDLDDAPDLAADEPAGRAWPHGPVLVLGVVALLLFGAAGGFSVARSTSGAAPGPPAAGSVDVGFAQDMSVHHDQAVTMATIARDDGTDPRIRTMAADMAATQTSQIGRMQGWLELWGAPALPPGGRHMGWMAGGEHAGAHGGAGGVDTMPGMASSEELAQLRAATGPELDTLFLQLMLRHHQGGAGMLSHAAQHAAVPQVRNLASQMLGSQGAEERQLQQMLAERGAAPLPFP